ncbi:MAG: methyltransferase [Clostridia bacterium]|nr:methyltransferase [Clostridia bacterium]
MKNLENGTVQAAESAEVGIEAGEQIDDLLKDGLVIIQKKGGFRYGTDAVVLSKFADITGCGEVLDIGTGGGIIPILLSSENKTARFTGIDVMPEAVGMARRSARLNGLQDRIEFIEADVREAPEILKGRRFDAVVTNPPYKTGNSGLPNSDYSKYVARHEVLCTLEDVISAPANLLKKLGRFFMVQRPDRLADSLELMRRYGIEPKKLVFVHYDASRAPVMFLVKGVLGAGRELKVGAPLILSDTDAGGTAGTAPEASE